MIKTKNRKDMIEKIEKTTMLYSDSNAIQAPEKVDIIFNLTYKNVAKNIYRNRVSSFESKVDYYYREAELYIHIYMDETEYPAIRITDKPISCNYFMIKKDEIAITSEFYFACKEFIETDYVKGREKLKENTAMYNAEFIVCKKFKSIMLEFKITKI